MPTVLIIPGLAVRTYAKPAAAALASRGHDVHLLRAPTWGGAPTDLRRYGEVLARRLEEQELSVDLLVGLSVGTQAAAWAAASTRSIRRVLLISPTIDPRNRSYWRLARLWFSGDPKDDPQDPVMQFKDWSHAGLFRVAQGYRSCVRDHIEDALGRVSAEVTVVHADHDSLGSAAWAQGLAELAGGRYIRRIGAPHSWPVRDEQAFADLVGKLTR